MPNIELTTVKDKTLLMVEVFLSGSRPHFIKAEGMDSGAYVRLGSTHAGLLTVEQEGRFQRYRANMPLMLDLVAHLTEECCAGDATQCEALRGASRVAPGILPPLARPRSEAEP